MDYPIKLKAKIVESGVSQKDLARELGLSIQGLNQKLNGRAPMSIEEANKIIKILKLKNPGSIFFNEVIS